MTEEHRRAQPFSQPVPLRRSETRYEKTVRPKPSRDALHKRGMFIPWHLGDRVERGDGVKCLCRELHRGHVGMNKRRLRYSAPGARDLRKRGVDAGDPKTARGQIPRDRHARATSKIKHRCCWRQLLDELCELCSSHRRSAKQREIIVCYLVIAFGDYSFDVILCHGRKLTQDGAKSRNLRVSASSFEPSRKTR